MIWGGELAMTHAIGKYLNIVNEMVVLFSCNVFNDDQLLLIKVKIHF